MSNEPWRRPAIIAQTQLLLDSFEYWTGKQLLERTGTIEEQARALFSAPFVVASHGAQPEPMLTYGNQLALELWEMNLIPPSPFSPSSTFNRLVEIFRSTVGDISPITCLNVVSSEILVLLESGSARSYTELITQDLTRAVFHYERFRRTHPPA